MCIYNVIQTATCTRLILNRCILESVLKSLKIYINIHYGSWDRYIHRFEIKVLLLNSILLDTLHIGIEYE